MLVRGVTSINMDTLYNVVGLENLITRDQMTKT